MSSISKLGAATRKMPVFLNNHAKSRTRSVQLDKKIDNNPRRFCEPCVIDGPSPAPSFRSSSLPAQENQLPIRHYRSMLVVDAPAIGPLKPITYDELHVHKRDFDYGILNWQAPGEAASLLIQKPFEYLR